MFADPFELIKTVQPGIMLYGVAGPSLDETQFIFLIREEDRYIKKLSKYPFIQIRLGIFEDITPAIGVLIMVQFENNPELTYDGWLNYCASITQIDKLTGQDNLIFQFYSSTECIRTLAINNSLSSMLSDIFIKAKQKDWSMAEFDAVKNYIYNKYQPTELWTLLGK